MAGRTPRTSSTSQAVVSAFPSIGQFKSRPRARVSSCLGSHRHLQQRVANESRRASVQTPHIVSASSERRRGALRGARGDHLHRATDVWAQHRRPVAVRIQDAHRSTTVDSSDPIGDPYAAAAAAAGELGLDDGCEDWPQNARRRQCARLQQLLVPVDDGRRLQRRNVAGRGVEGRGGLRGGGGGWGTARVVDCPCRGVRALEGDDRRQRRTQQQICSGIDTITAPFFSI